MTINCKGTLIDLTSPKVMGILNITPDSFYDGGRYKSDSEILTHTSKMLHEGATFIDVGAYSSRPGAQHISETEELHRILPVIELLIQEFPDIIISVDSFRSTVAREGIIRGAAIINDISGGNIDRTMFPTVAELQVPYVLMHMPGTPQNMQKNIGYTDVTFDLIQFFAQKILELKQLQVHDIIVDVGFGFGKTVAHNYELLKNLSLFKSLDAPLLVGLSRKSMLHKTLGINALEALNATTSANTIALLNGASILRVHDVKEAVETAKIFNRLMA